jgi:hypothetical protein
MSKNKKGFDAKLNINDLIDEIVKFDVSFEDEYESDNMEIIIDFSKDNCSDYDFIKKVFYE